MADIINIPEEYHEYIRPEKRTIEKNDRVINTYFSDLTLSQKDALEDFETYKYLMDNVYSGRDYWSMHGVDFKAGYAQIENKLRHMARISSAELAWTIYETFSGKIIDNHLGIRAMVSPG